MQKNNHQYRKKPPKGYRLDPSYKVAAGTSLYDAFYPTGMPHTPLTITLPTRGTFAEAIPGGCNLCEKIEDDRAQDWTVFTTDEPTAINPLDTGSRYQNPGNLQTKDLASPLVNIQNAPAAPDPQGLQALANLLGKPDLFKDMTGLEGTQNLANNAMIANAIAQQARIKAATDAMNALDKMYEKGQIDSTQHKEGKKAVVDGAFKAKEFGLPVAEVGGENPFPPSQSLQDMKAAGVESIKTDGKGGVDIKFGGNEADIFTNETNIKGFLGTAEAKQYLADLEVFLVILIDDCEEKINDINTDAITKQIKQVRKNELLACQNEIAILKEMTGVYIRIVLENVSVNNTTAGYINLKYNNTPIIEVHVKRDSRVRFQLSCLAHELKHVYQAYQGKLDFSINTDRMGILYNIDNEIEAYKRQMAIHSLSLSDSLGQENLTFVTEGYVRGLGQGEYANLPSALNVDSVMNTILQAHAAVGAQVSSLQALINTNNLSNVKYRDVQQFKANGSYAYYDEVLKKMMNL